MRRFRGYWSLITIVVVAALALLYTVVAGNKPLLGLDLQGGVSVVLQPDGPVDGEADRRGDADEFEHRNGRGSRLRPLFIH